MIEQLDAAIKHVAPIYGVSIGRKDDKTTWRIDFMDEATDDQRKSALAVIDGFDVAAALVAAPTLEQRVAALQVAVGLTDANVATAIRVNATSA